MTMLPVCSATSSCSSHSQISLHGGRLPLSSYHKTFEVRCTVHDRVALGLSSEIHLQGVSFERQDAKSFCSSFFECAEKTESDFSNMPYHKDGLDSMKCKFPNSWRPSTSVLNELHNSSMGDLKFVESSSVYTGEGELMNSADPLTTINILPETTDLQTITTSDVIPDNPTLLPDSLNMNNDSLSNSKPSIEDISARINESISASVNKGENAMRNLLDTITSSVASAFKAANATVDNAVNKLISAADQTGDSANSKLTGFSNDLKEASSKVGIISLDVLRRGIVAVEDSLMQGASFVVYAYGSAKELLPLEIQNILKSSEESTVKILRPAGTAFEQVYIGLEGLEKTLGLDPNDPIVPFVLFLGTLAISWGCYWALTYGGYAGDLSPKLTLELLTGMENAVLVDVRPEDLREKDGIPDLRRTARFRYANVTLPEVEGPIRRLLKSGREVDDSLIAVVIRNLKIVHDRSKVIVMDADGTRSKGIARSLRKLGIKRPYLVQGGFRSWTKQGFRIKELKSETTFTILNEEAEAILEAINPTPLQVFGYSMVFIAALYALLEWEKTLQFIGVVGLGQTLFRRVASYEDSEDFKQDVRLLLAPVRWGSQAILWAVNMFGTNLNGLPTSPSSSDVQSRVLQAAAKHESQPSDNEEIQVSSPETMDPITKNVDLSEA